MNVTFPNRQFRIGPFLMEEGREEGKKEGIINKTVNRSLYYS